MSRRVGLRLVTGRAVDEELDGLADEEAQVLDDEVDSEPQPQPPALGVTPAATASG
jgi:hypothetical protein